MVIQTARATPAEARAVRSALLEGAEFLLAAGIESARLDAEVLLRHVLGMEQAELLLSFDTGLGVSDERRFRELLLRRARREPVAYITGRKEFWSLDFVVTSDVLVPRPETELLVEVALENLRQLAGNSAPRVLDLGTGSGAIAICLAKACPEARIWAVDISFAALAVARLNGERHGVGSRIRFLQGDFLEPLASERRSFDLIVSNPPYVRSRELSTLAPEIGEWEPMMALDGGLDGLDAYRQILDGAHRYLRDGGGIVLEIGADMAGDVDRLLDGASCYAGISVHQDYAGKDRVIAATKAAP